MKKVLISSALAASLAIPSLAFDLYSDETTKVGLYGSIRGYMGGSYTANGVEGGGAANRGGYLIGIQNNSHFGVNVAHEKFKAQVEVGGAEPGVGEGGAGAPLRKFWGSYTTGVGTILFGKADTPTTDIGFISNWLNNDNGAQGFGGVATGNRRIQLQYNLAGLSVALVEDNVGVGRSTKADEFPRISLAYTIKGDKGAPFFKVAYNYKKYTSASGLAGGVNQGDVAWDIWAAIRPTFGNAYLSVLANYGVDAHLYGIQTTNFNRGNYQNDSITTMKDVKRTGANVELGFNLGQKLALTLGGGYQKTFGKGVGQQGNVSAASGYINLPYKVSSNFTFVPQVAYYYANGNPSVLNAGGNNRVSSVIAAARFQYDF